jgi:plasmid maintenance system killer protein
LGTDRPKIGFSERSDQFERPEEHRKSTGKLTDDLEGYWSIRVNNHYRICFRFEAGNAN